MASRDARWYRSRRAGSGHQDRAGARNIRARAGPDRPACPLAPVCRPEVKPSFVQIPLSYRTRLRVPDLLRVLRDRAVAGEPPGAGDVEDRFARPPLRVCIDPAKLSIRVEIGFEVREMHVMVAMGQQRVVEG